MDLQGNPSVLTLKADGFVGLDNFVMKIFTGDSVIATKMKDPVISLTLNCHLTYSRCHQLLGPYLFLWRGKKSTLFITGIKYRQETNMVENLQVSDDQY